MMLSRVSLRHWQRAKLGTSASRTLATSSSGQKPVHSTTAATAQKKVNIGNTESSSGSGRVVVVAMAAVIGALGAVSFQMETDADFRSTAETYIPGVAAPLFATTRSALRNLGVVDVPSARPPAPTIRERVPVTESSFEVAVSQELVEKPIEENISDAAVIVAEEQTTFAAGDVDNLEDTDHIATVLDQPEIAIPEEHNPAAARDIDVAIGEEASSQGDQIEAEVASFSNPPVVEPTSVEPVPAPTGRSLVEAEAVELPSVAGTVENQYKDESYEFRREIERHYLADIDNLDPTALKKRMYDLVADYADRSKWEAVRLHQSVRHVEKEIGDQYKSSLAKQMAELELKIERELVKRETDVRVEMSHIINDLREAQEFRIQDALKSQEKALQLSFDKERSSTEEKIRRDAEQEHLADLAKFKMEQMNKMLELHKSLEDAQSHVCYFDKVSDQIIDEKRRSALIHEASAAILELEVAMGSSRPVRAEIASVKKYCSSDSVVAHLVESIPEDISARGAPPMTELKARFSVAKEEARKAALAPSNAPKMIGQMIGSTLAALLWEVEGNVKGESEEAVLARASFFLDHGNLQPAVDELSNLRGYPKTLVHDWESCAHRRLVADQTISCLKAAAALEHLERSS